MKLLDKFRSQPEWQSADPAVRLSAIRDLPDDASTDDLLAEIGRQDPDPQVRREAVARLLDLDALLSIAEAESDDTVRSEALAVVRELVVESTDESTATKGLAGIRDERDLVTVARAAGLVSIARAALGRLTTARAMGTVARRATHAEVAAEALSWLVERGESDELVAVAAKAEKKAALQAFDRLAGFLADSGDVDRTRDVLTQLSRQARDKAVQRRARSAIEQLGGGGVTEAGVAPATGHDGLCRDVERLAAEETDLEHGRAALDRFVTRWSELAAPDDEALASRFAAARTAAEARLEALEQSIAEARRQTEERHAAVSARVELCERVLALPGDADDDTLAGIRATWDALPPAAADGDAGVEAQLVEITRRFEQAVAAHPERRERHGGIVTALDEAEKLLAGLEQQLDPPAAADGATAEAEGGTTPPARVPRAWAKVTRGWRPLVERIEKDADAAQRAILAQLRERHASLEPRWQRVVQEAQATRAKTEETNLRRLEQKVAKIESVSASDKLTLVEAERQLRGVRRLLSQPGPVPGEARDALSKKLKQLQTTLAGRLRELKEFADWQRWANLGIQEQLCRRMEALTMLADDEAGNAQLAAGFRDIMAEWRKASDVPKAQGDALWERFKKAHDAVHPRVEQQLGVEAGQREANQATLEKLVEEAETLSTSSDWLNTVRRITELQAEWKAVGPAPRRAQRELWTRFRAACNAFFGRRKEDLAERKKVWGKNLELKQALCERVEALATAEDPKAAIPEVRKAQTEWKSVGPVRRTKSDTIWQRFRTACDAVYERVQEGERAVQAARAAEREAICTDLEALSTPVVLEPPAPEAVAEGGAETAATPAAVTTEARATETTEPVEASTGEPAESAAIESTDAAVVTESPDGESPSADAATPEGEAAGAAEPAAMGEAAPVAETVDDTTPVAEAVADAAPPVDVAPAADSAPPDAILAADATPTPTADATPAADVTPTPAADAPQAADATPSPEAAPPPPAPEPSPPATGPAPADEMSSADLGAAVQTLQQRWREAPDVPPPLGRRLSTRYAQAISTLVERYPDAFAGTDLDPARIRKRLEKLCERVEGLLPEETAPDATLSPAELLASTWRDRLASNLMGARADDAQRKREAGEEVRRIKQDYRRLPTLGGDEAQRLATRFHQACEKVLRWAGPPPPRPSSPPRSSRPPRGRRPPRKDAAAS